MQRHRRTTSPEGMISVKSYVFKVALEQEEDGRWSAWIETLPGCTTWGHTKAEALEALQDAAEAYVEDIIEAGEELPKKDVLVVDAPVITVISRA